ncbi:MAG: hypothetical protein NZ805_08860 [Armatimonadetes bacterium]|nr:hypothetical protein [Armatimonadota bacterium]
MNSEILATAAYKRWQVVNFVALFATLAVAGGWALFNYEPVLRWRTFAFATFKSLFFVGFGIACPLRFRKRSKPDDLIFLLTLTANSFIAVAWLL